MSHRRKIGENKKLEKMNNNSAWPIYFDEEKGRLIRCYRGSRSKFIKRLGNRKLRRYRGELLQNGKYKKYFDFWWEYD